MKCNIRVGFGYDVHVFVEGRPLIIGGVEIPHEKGLLGHSDADVLLHAISDALLGAANLRDIGFHFPDTDPKYKGADSKVLLRGVLDLLKGKGYEVGNIDSTLVAERPKMNPHIPQMQSVISNILQIDVEDVSIKATTNEKMGFAGREEGIVAYATVLIYKP
ncbi:2-C-methyl-D-erythritol 2,4-cyclodiphosphate synthase [Porphyromonas sp.]|uniref:2-C-methyl-D-erythritol 2,4-cyclodiphosphate synthase n=1 Tax=Porphyromonas sp. TaxID=1924944 RepID=UPI0026DCB58E|nr:2-C-methyl-D-erythritol 2,4-cyclodiphosphate synthase [Porphyromonas sp.]MDO4695513.1 2-C-methyl-D-erythritol 2,4-cyclodiphosphate synthase [Porphyromonas sp.]MDO4770246.1 2-C-methyl-D-erythritol 2,4-cyclodiphosphate synthase [Porphyromonas sp.]